MTRILTTDHLLTGVVVVLSDRMLISGMKFRHFSASEAVSRSASADLQFV